MRTRTRPSCHPDKGNRWTTEKQVGKFDLDWLGERWNKNGMDTPVEYIRTLWRPGPTVGLLSNVMDLRHGRGANRGTGKGRYKAAWVHFVMVLRFNLIGGVGVLL